MPLCNCTQHTYIHTRTSLCGVDANDALWRTPKCMCVSKRLYMYVCLCENCVHLINSAVQADVLHPLASAEEVTAPARDLPVDAAWKGPCNASATRAFSYRGTAYTPPEVRQIRIQRSWKRAHARCAKTLSRRGFPFCASRKIRESLTKKTSPGDSSGYVRHIQRTLHPSAISSAAPGIPQR